MNRPKLKREPTYLINVSDAIRESIRQIPCVGLGWANIKAIRIHARFGPSGSPCAGNDRMGKIRTKTEHQHAKQASPFGAPLKKEFGQHLLKNPLIVNSIVEKVMLLNSSSDVVLNSHLGSDQANRCCAGNWARYRKSYRKASRESQEGHCY